MWNEPNFSPICPWMASMQISNWEIVQHLMNWCRLKQGATGVPTWISPTPYKQSQDRCPHTIWMTIHINFDGCHPLKYFMGCERIPVPRSWLLCPVMFLIVDAIPHQPKLYYPALLACWHSGINESRVGDLWVKGKRLEARSQVGLWMVKREEWSYSLEQHQ